MTRISTLGTLLLMVVLGLLLGLGITWNSLSSTAAPGTIANGSWVIWPKAGAPDADPYSLAIHARRGDVPMALGEGLALFAIKDSEGRHLSGRCNYEITGHFPTARVWSIAAYHNDGRLIENPAGRYGLTSSEAILEDGANRIRIGATPMPGNWLPVDKDNGFVVILRFYETPLSAIASVIDWTRMPRLTVTGCQP